MPAAQFKEDLLGLDRGDIRRSWPERMAGKSAAARLIELVVMISSAESSVATPRWCFRCQGNQDPQRSTSHYPKVFCSEHCEVECIRTALGSLTLQDCVRMQRRLEDLLMPQKPRLRRPWILL